MAEFEIDGDCEAQFLPLRQAMEENFRERGEVGAAVAVAHRGRLVTDLWGGVASEQGAPWRRDTLVNVWSASKGVTAACFAMIASRGLIDYDRPVAAYWPEFAAHGKGEVTVAMLLSHQAGLCGFREPATLSDLYDAPAAARRLAAMAPFWEPGTKSGYHAVTVGLLATELFRKIEGRSLKQFVAEELPAFDLTIGLPPDREHRAATTFAPDTLTSAPLSGDAGPVELAAHANPVLLPTLPNTAQWRAAEIPSANGFTHARGLAELYSALLAEPVNGPQLADADTLQAARKERIAGVDAVLGVETRWASGFLLNVFGMYGANPTAFGHPGWGGTLAFADPDRRLAFAYTPNMMGSEAVGDPRAFALTGALEKCLAD